MFFERLTGGDHEENFSIISSQVFRPERQPERMEVEKVFVKKDNMAQLFCRKCNTLRKVSTEKTYGGRKPVRVKCKCGYIFAVRFDFRKCYRKKIGLQGYYATGPGYDNWVGIMVRNLSMDGVGFLTDNRPQIKVGDEIKIKFQLDDVNQSGIEKHAVVKVLKNRYLGCQFIVKSKGYDKALGFYLNI
jgi:hypothetical protein